MAGIVPNTRRIDHIDILVVAATGLLVVAQRSGLLRDLLGLALVGVGTSLWIEIIVYVYIVIIDNLDNLTG